LRLASSPSFPVVSEVAVQSPASDAGVKVGEELLAVDGLETSGVELTEVRARLAGSPNTRAILRLRLPGATPRTVSLLRGAVAASPFDCHVLGRRILYLRIRAVAPGTARAVGETARSAGDMARQVILDLRGTSVGTFEEAAVLSDLLLSSGVTVTRERRSKLEKRIADPGTSALETSMALVLVDAETEGVVEAIAAALQDNHRAKVLGAPTRGDGELFSFYVLKGPAFLRLTSGHFIRPNGRPLRGNRVVPDLAVEQAAVQKREPIEDVACPGRPASHSIANDAAIIRAVAEFPATP
jgi:carboxyl-terminal processing protease